MNTTPSFKFEGLSQEEAQFVIACVGEKPFNMVASLINKLGTQLENQVRPPKPTGPLDAPAATNLTDAVQGLPETLDMPSSGQASPADGSEVLG